MMRHIAFCVLAGLVLSAAARADNDTVLVEAESFKDRGGWELDTQFIHIVGSPYLLAHGLGEPVKDATTLVRFPHPGSYKVFVRTKDWVARWKAPGAPGKFQLLVNDKALAETFGTQSADWFWQPGGSVEIPAGDVKLALHDLTGFDGRCDAILFTAKADYTPPNDSTPLAQWRRDLLGLPAKPDDVGKFDLVVVGGGYGGMGAALSAARMGCKVALIQERPVLGGNGSSEIRVWAMGGIRMAPYPHVGEMIEELADRSKKSPGQAADFGDDKKTEIMRAEQNLALFLNTHAYTIEKEGNRITAVLAMDTVTSRPMRFAGRFFVDATGHCWVGAAAGAEISIKETGHMGMSNMWRWKTADTPQTFPDAPWALDLKMDDFPYPKNGAAEWFWETGFNKHPIDDLEYIRDWNLRAVFGAFNAMKNKDGKEKHLNAKLEWVAYVGGPRESRQILGDVILTRDDIVQKHPFPDACVPSTWDIDLHYPKEQFAKKFPDDPFISRAEFGKAVDRKAGYPVPYRCFYSRNIDNLFMAGRDISVTHEALGTVRVMKTGGMVGEVAGKAASLCAKYNCTPRDIYTTHWEEMKKLLWLPGSARRESVSSPIPETSPDEQKALLEQHTKQIKGLNLPGIVIDDTQAILKGKWTEGTGLPNFIGPHYIYHANGGDASARFEFKVPETGYYEVRFAVQPHQNRASNAAVSVISAEGEKTLKVNEKAEPTLPNSMVSLGKYSFEAGKAWAVVVSATGADGNVAADAVQILPAK